MDIEILPINDILVDDNFNCRGAMAPIDVQDLAKDIQENGLHQPIVVMEHNQSEIAATNKKYKLVAGFRRTYAHIILKREQIPAVIKTHLTSIQALVLNFAENTKRKDLNILQEAQVIKRLESAGVKQEIMAQTVGMSRGWVCARLDLLKLPDDVQAEAAAGMLNQYQVRELAKFADNSDAVYAAVRKIKIAKAKGESIKGLLGGRKKPKATKRVYRTPKEILNMIDYIAEQIGMGVETRVLAWCAGNISDVELFVSFREKYPNFEDPKDMEF